MPQPDAIVQKTIEACEAVYKTWGSAHLGLLLVAAYFRDKPVGTEDLAEITGLSTETVRRKLKPLWNVDRVETIRDGRSISYVATRHWAEHTASLLERNAYEAGFVDGEDTG